MLRLIGVLCILLTVLRIDAAVPPHQGEHERLPHEAFEDEHYKDGRHHEDLDHQAILGSKKEAEEFDHLSPEESKKRLRKLAEKMDKDGDGFVDKNELTDWIHHSLQELDNEELEERFGEMDANHDGKISWEEYRSDAFGDEDEKDENGEPILDADDKKLMEEDQLYFRAADKDGDKSLTREEFAGFQNPEHHTHMHQTLVDLTLKEKDSDKNGFISLDEFIGDNTGSDRPEQSEWYQVEKDRFEQEYDRNKDGHLDQEEIKLWLVPDITQTAKDETEHLFTEADANKDGKLSVQEIVDEHQLFVGSEATNYGEHLNKIEL